MSLLKATRRPPALVLALCVALRFGPCVSHMSAVLHLAEDVDSGVLVELLEATGLTKPFAESYNSGRNTILAPSNAAFEKLLTLLNVTKAQLIARPDLQDIMKFHMISGSKVLSSTLSDSKEFQTMLGSKVTVTNSNGVVKVGGATVQYETICSDAALLHLDAVLLPPANVVNTVLYKGNSMMMMALQKAQLESVLSAPGPFTVFVPTDAAFAALLVELNITKAELLARADLKEILEFHVLEKNKAMSFALSPTQNFVTLSGDELTVTKRDGVVMSGRAQVIVPDVDCTNGAIHLIDQVLLPPGLAPALTSAPMPAPGEVKDGGLLTSSSTRALHFWSIVGLGAVANWV